MSNKYSSKYTKEKKKVFSLHYHLIFVVKYRKKVFTVDTEIVNDLKNIFEKISQDFDVEVIEQEADLNHVHLLISAKPTLDIPKYINILKGHSSRYLRKEYKDHLSDKLWGDSLWSPSYFIASTGNVSLEILKQYVKNQ